MKPQILKVTNGSLDSFNIRRDTVPCVNNHWHYHSEIEIVYFKKGSGTQFIGDNIKQFQSGDIIMIGSYLPHYWRFDDIYFNNAAKSCVDVQVVHFNEFFWGEQFLNLPENKLIKTILCHSKRGIQVKGKTQGHIIELFSALLNAESSKKIILLMELLMAIGQCKIVQLSSLVFQRGLPDLDTDRINAIYEYSLVHFKKDIRLNEVAELAKISPNSFCRFFKSRTQKTYTQFMNEIRVGNACKLLIENKINVKQICYESGYNNMTSFHKSFKLVTGKSPLSYQKDFFAENHLSNLEIYQKDQIHKARLSQKSIVIAPVESELQVR